VGGSEKHRRRQSSLGKVPPGRAVLLARVIDRWLAEHIDDPDQVDELIDRLVSWDRFGCPGHDAEQG
jgi:hypothetical protein